MLANEAGISLVEIAIAVALLGLVVTTAITTLMALNKNAFSTRVMSSAREVVQRNIEAAIGVPFNSSSEPNILKFTTAPGGDPWDDTGGAQPVTIYGNREGSAPLTGTLKRSVTSETNSVGADLRRVTFNLTYNLYGHDISYQMSTIRAMDR